ncbi:MAG: gliding motility-associated C-terminal domain-containing protein, partial [Flavobacteriales bacterium]|nr:gliding motility-associated C-terminal domain-containing protein [Flavobacteriales bacterium]
LTDGTFDLPSEGGVSIYSNSMRRGVCGFNDGSYRVTVSDDNECSITASIEVKRPDSVSVKFDWISDPIEPQADGYYIGPLDVQFIDLSTNRTLNENIWRYWMEHDDPNTNDVIITEEGEALGDSIPSYVFEHRMPTRFFAKLTVSKNGFCPASDSLSFNVSTPSCLQIPNVFTPNGDGVNDIFEMIDHCYLEFFEGDIYNRWGGKLYHWESPEAAWDGRTLAGREVPDGVYFYVISAKGFDGVNRVDVNNSEVETVAGTVTIIR